MPIESARVPSESTRSSHIIVEVTYWAISGKSPGFEFTCANLLLVLVQEFLRKGGPLQITILSLIEGIALSLEGDLRVLMPMILPDLLTIPENDTRPDRLATLKTLNVMMVLDTNIDEYLHLAVPALVNILERVDSPFFLRKAAIQTYVPVLLIDYSGSGFYAKRSTSPVLLVGSCCP